MCGICGFIGKGSIEDLNRMRDAMAHRGPDDSGSWQCASPAVFLGHRRLSIVDLSGGLQPMSTPDGRYTIVFNGEIYNHMGIRRELEKAGHRFQTDHSDTETLLIGYSQWGKTITTKLNGMWSFAIYDAREKTLFLSRDRFGKKPLYYTSRNGFFGFASELTALANHPETPHSISRRSLMKFFAYGYVPAPGTIFEGCSKLPAGCSMTVNAMDLSHKVERYWDFVLEPFENPSAKDEADWCERLRSLIQDAVKRRLMSDVPLGIFLSGGIDSSSVAAFASRNSPAGKVKTFSIGFEDASFDESGQAAAMAQLLGTEHTAEVLSIEKARTILPEILGRLDEPTGDSSLLPTYLLCRGTRKHVTVALGGDGADELFCGYDPFRAIRLASFYDAVAPRPVHRAISAIAGMMPVSHANMSFDFKVKRALRGLSFEKRLWNPIWLGPLSPDGLSELFSEKIDLEDVYSEAIEQWDNCRQANLYDKTLQFYTKLYLQDDILPKVDRASMMSSLEVRAPYLDIKLVDFVRKIPWQYKYRNGQTKYILKKALEPVLPHDTLYRPKKGFGVPIGRWFRDGSLKFPDNPQFQGLSKEFCSKMIDGHTSNAQDNRAFLWNLFVLQNMPLFRKTDK